MILLRAADAALFAFVAVVFNVDFGFFIIAAAPTTIAPAMAVRSFDMLVLRLT